MKIRGMIELATLISRRQLHVISRSVTNIKPASPTPLYFKRYNLPTHDQMSPHSYIPMILYYSDSDQNSPETIPNQLKYSLSQTLSKYYPFAGRLMSGSYVDCNDEGVPLIEAQIGCKLSQVLNRAPEKGEDGILTYLFPPRATWNSIGHQDPILVVQLNHFACGGIAITASISHRLADAFTLCSFVRYWATLSCSRHSGDYKKFSHLHPHFQLPQFRVDKSKLLVVDADDSSTEAANSYHEKRWMCKEIVFHNTKIAKLKAVIEIEEKLQGVVMNQNYTRNELVTALLYKCTLAAAVASNSGAYSSSVLCQTVNVRPLIDPPLPETSVGNFMTLNHFPTSTESDTKLSSLVDRIRKGKMQLRGRKSIDEFELSMPILAEYTRNKQRTFIVSSMCNFPLYDGMDFGWGRPIKGTIPPFVDFTILMDTPSGDGIKAIVGLEEQDMEKFQADKELLTYASF